MGILFVTFHSENYIRFRKNTAQMKILTVFPMPPQCWAGTFSENGVLILGSGSHNTPQEVIRTFQAMGLRADHIEIEGSKQAVPLGES